MPKGFYHHLIRPCDAIHRRECTIDFIDKSRGRFRLPQEQSLPNGFRHRHIRDLTLPFCKGVQLFCERYIYLSLRAGPCIRVRSLVGFIALIGSGHWAERGQALGQALDQQFTYFGLILHISKQGVPAHSDEWIAVMVDSNGAPGRSRTCDPRLRRPGVAYVSRCI